MLEERKHWLTGHQVHFHLVLAGHVLKVFLEFDLKSWTGCFESVPVARSEGEQRVVVDLEFQNTHLVVVNYRKERLHGGGYQNHPRSSLALLAGSWK